MLLCEWHSLSPDLDAAEQRRTDAIQIDAVLTVGGELIELLEEPAIGSGIPIRGKPHDLVFVEQAVTEIPDCFEIKQPDQAFLESRHRKRAHGMRQMVTHE